MPEQPERTFKNCVFEGDPAVRVTSVSREWLDDATLYWALREIKRLRTRVKEMEDARSR